MFQTRREHIPLRAASIGVSPARRITVPLVRPPPRMLAGSIFEVLATRAMHGRGLCMLPGKPVAYNYGLLWLIYGLLWGIVANCFWLLGVPFSLFRVACPTVFQHFVRCTLLGSELPAQVGIVGPR